MQSTYEKRISEATNIQRNILQGDAKLCIPPFGALCRAWWSTKTAENLASRIDCSVRAAAYQISGESKVSPESIAFVVAILAGREKL